MNRFFITVLCIFILFAFLTACNENSEVSEVSHNSGNESSDLPNESSQTSDINSDITNTESEESNDVSADIFPDFSFPVEDVEIPENIIYNTLDIIKSETYYDPSHGPAFPEGYEGTLYAGSIVNDTNSNLKKLAESHKGDNETWFYVAISCQNITGWSTGVFILGDRIAEINNVNEYLVNLGMIPDYTHPWSYRKLRSTVRDDWQKYNIVGYMTADMINSIDAPAHECAVLHLTEPDLHQEALEFYNFTDK